MNRVVGFLLREGCPSIKFRVKKEILGEQDNQLHKEIFQDPLVQKFLKLQGKSGWIEEDFHGVRGVETACRVFSEKGLEPHFPPFSRMLIQLESKGETFDLGSLQRVGKILDRKGFGGSQMIRASVFARAGWENSDLVREQIKKALACFAFVRGVNGIEEITTLYKNRRVFVEGVMWPGIYHLRLLAFTSHWRTVKNLEIIREGIKKMVEMSPLPWINVREKSQLISPPGFAMQNFKPVMEEMKPGEWMLWFHRTELIARLGVAREINEINDQLACLKRVRQEGDGLFSRKMSHKNFFDWSPYTGLALERNWRSPVRRISDLSFRSLLIEHFSEGGNPPESGKIIKQNREEFCGGSN